MRVKYSPLPREKPDVTGLLVLEPDLDGSDRVWLRDEVNNEVNVLTLEVSLWSLRLKSCCGVLLKERASMWWRERVVGFSGSDCMDSDSGHESVGGWGREWRSGEWVWNSTGYEEIKGIDMSAKKMEKRKALCVLSSI